ncbi:unnamed protein product [Owenia fusiformis]|uniref:Uncharacterized protein n=1 Tax=Owenia fusiformis TaxID=6347 RepID=A0A8J1UUR0_OWEFU|nr:unnamed protein product [Owenia fusiformis]
MEIAPWLKSLIIAFTAIPITYNVNLVQTMELEGMIPLIGFSILLGVVMVMYFLLRENRPHDPFYYFYTLASFGAICSMLIALEADKYINGFFAFYFKNGEVYLTTPYGALCSYWDGTGHLAMYLLMMRAISNKQNYRILGLYWAGSLINSMIVLLVGSVVGNFGIKSAYLMNMPWFIFPIIATGCFLKQRPNQSISVKMANEHHVTIFQRPQDIFFILYLVAALVVSIIRGFSLLGCDMEFFTSYLSNIEPYLNDPASYGKMQGFVYFFYFSLYYVMAIYGFLSPGQSWMVDWSMIHAGAAIQSQVCFIGGALYPRTPADFRVKMFPQGNMWFWLINLGLAIVPQLIAYRCYNQRKFFTPQVSKKQY